MKHALSQGGTRLCKVPEGFPVRCNEREGAGAFVSQVARMHDSASCLPDEVLRPTLQVCMAIPVPAFRMCQDVNRVNCSDTFDPCATDREGSAKTQALSFPYSPLPCASPIATPPFEQFNEKI